MLAAVADYPTWWPQVRSVKRIDDDSATVEVRSVLPYTLHLVLTREVEDPGTGLLRVRIGGDLVGWSQWELAEDSVSGRTAAEFTEEVQVTGALGVAARPAAPLMRANHLAMMRGGERGLAALLMPTKG